MSNSYLFYDLETTGLNKCFDQVLQFAAIRADLDLNELEHHEILIKLNPDVIPTPQAVLVHGISLETMQSGIAEYEAMRKIHSLFNTPGTITVGYNSLGFDDEFLRFSFYRNLLTPYTHQYANNCSRMDIYPMVVMYYLFKPEILVWPKIAGNINLKLEQLGQQNGLIDGNPHHAMSDVKVTLKLARLLMKERAMWEYLTGYFDKKIDLARCEKLTWVDDKYQQAILVDGSIGGAKFYQAPVIGLGSHEHYKNQSLWLSLENQLVRESIVNRKRFGESPILLPLTEHFGRYLTEGRKELITNNLSWIQKNPKLFSEIVEYHRGYKYPEIPNLDIDAALYQNGFISDWDKLECDNFHVASPADKIALTLKFSNPALRTMAVRVLGRNYPEILARDSMLNIEFNNYLHKIKSDEMMVNYKNEPRLTPSHALAEIKRLQEEKDLSAAKSQILMDLAKYIQSW